jgi:hypothetical protein
MVDRFSLNKDVDILENNRMSAIKDVWDNLPMCRWLLSLDTTKHKIEDKSGLQQESEELKIFKLMVERNGLGILRETDYFIQKSAYRFSFDILEWLIAGKRGYMIGCFNTAAADGRLDVCKALARHFNITAVEVRESESLTFRMAVKKGQLDVCRWLTRHFELTTGDARSNNNHALRMASKKGHLEVCQWLINEFNLTVNDVRTEDNAALRMAARQGHLAICQLLTSHFGLTKEDAQSNDNYAWRMAERKGHLVICQWLVKRFGL